MEEDLKLPEGHGEICYGCEKKIDSLAGDPTKWASFIMDEGYPQYWHVGCLTEAVHKKNILMREAVSKKYIFEVVIEDGNDEFWDDPALVDEDVVKAFTDFVVNSEWWGKVTLKKIEKEF